MRTMLFTASTILFASIFGVTGTGEQSFNRKGDPSLNSANSWLNSQPLNLTDLRGKVVLIDFWTYTCINWRRTLPYIRAWSSKYKDQSLVVIGVHSPEFSFEQKLENVTAAIHEMNIEYPVAVDNQYEIWHSFQNEYWPALYLIDAKGKIRYQKFGEGNYKESELQIQQLLKEASAKYVSDKPVDLHPKGFEIAADWESLQSTENYIGSDRRQGFVSPERPLDGQQVVFSIPDKLKLNQWGLSGPWVFGRENARLGKGPGKIIYRFHARDLHLIMGLEIKGTSVKYHVLIDGNPPGPAHGLDIDSNGNGAVKEQRMYQLIRQQGAIIDHEIQIEFFDPGVEVYVFTFG
jgi:thiol-disulfide isomerase/thioredoxin